MKNSPRFQTANSRRATGNKPNAFLSTIATSMAGNSMIATLHGRQRHAKVTMRCGDFGYDSALNSSDDAAH
jgi:hypothetical protein